MSSAKTGILQIFSKLEDDEVIGLANTVTNGLLKHKICNRKGATDIILKYSSNEISILRRKCITKEKLFEYANENNIQVNFPVSKPDLIDTITSFWNKELINNHEEKLSESVKISTQNIQSPQNSDSSNINAMAEQFSAWFYEMLNQPYPIEREHFWDDSQITVNFITDNECHTETAEGDTQEIVQLLFKIRQENNLYFNPNLLTDGVQGRISPHGLVVILACGTIQINNECVGVFEQMFMLARDLTAEDNWKIKKSELILRRKSVSGVPKLCDTKLTNDLLSLSSS